MSAHIVIICMFFSGSSELDVLNFLKMLPLKHHPKRNMKYSESCLFSFPTTLPCLLAFVKMLFQNYWNLCQQQTRPEATE